jgi:RimJ/RimL family protein N-acetyltransferase
MLQTLRPLQPSEQPAEHTTCGIAVIPRLSRVGDGLGRSSVAGHGTLWHEQNAGTAAAFEIRENVLCVCDTLPVSDLAPPDPPLAGGQVALRLFRISDAAAIAGSVNRDPDIPRFTMMPEAMTEDQARQWVERGLEGWSRGLARFAVTVPPSDECAGQIGIQFDFAARRAEAFYWLDRRAQGRGIAVQSLGLVTEWAFRDHGIVRVQLVTHLGNERSQRVAERCGFSREGVLRAWEPVKDEQPDVVMWSRLASHPAPNLGHS